MKRRGPLREVMAVGSIQFPILNRLTILDQYLRAQRLPVTRCSDQLDFKPVVAITLIVEEKLRTTDKIGAILTIGNKQIKEPIIIVISPGRAAATTGYQVINTGAGSHIGKGPVPIVPVKIICSLSAGIAPRIDHVKVQVTIVIKISPGRRAIIAKGAKPGLIGYVRKCSVAVISVQSLLKGTIICSARNKKVKVAIIVVVTPGKRAAIGQRENASLAGNVSKCSVSVIL